MARAEKGGRDAHSLLGFWDETGIAERPIVQRSWAPHGETPVVRARARWQHHSAVGLIVCTPAGRRPRLLLRIVPGSVTQEDVIGTLKAMRRHLPGKLWLLWDGLPAHRGRTVRAFLAAQRSWIRVERFPAYAPELNPVEYLWSAAKRKDLANRCPADIAEMDDALRASARRLRRHPGVLQGFLKASGLFPGLSR